MPQFPMVKTVGIICKHDKKEAYDAATTLSRWLSDHDIASAIDSDAAERLGVSGIGREQIPEISDVIVVLGGDGTLLSVARLVGQRGIPIVGVNLGTLGFITTVPLSLLYQTMETVISGQYKVQPRMMLSVTVRRDGRKVEEHQVLNDVVINKGALARIVEMETYIDGSYVTVFKADGLIINTPTGSTGYCLSAGGPIVHPTMSCIGITPICPHTLTNRPLIIPDDAVLEVALRSGTEDVFMTLDGQVGFQIRCNDIVLVKKSEYKMYFVMSPEDDYFQMLRTKLKWGQA
jgi:NAD+ kinase